MADGQQFTLVMCGNNQNLAADTVRKWQAGMADVEGVIDLVAMNMPSMASGYNAAMARISTPYVIFSHQDAWPLEGCPVGEKFLRNLGEVDAFGFCGSHRMTGSRWLNAGPGACFGQVINLTHNPGMAPICVALWERPARLVTGIRVADGYCLVAKTSAIREVGGWDERYKHFHLYDLDICASLHAAGMKVGVCSDCYVVHSSQGSYQQPEWAVAAEQFMAKWAGKFDASYHDLGATFGSIQGHDIRIILQILKGMENRMADMVEL